MEQKLKQETSIPIGKNIRRLRLSRNMKQTELIRLLNLSGMSMTRETLVKIERGIQHIRPSQLKAIRDVLDTTYDELLKEERSS